MRQADGSSKTFMFSQLYHPFSQFLQFRLVPGSHPNFIISSIHIHTIRNIIQRARSEGPTSQPAPALAAEAGPDAVVTGAHAVCSHIHASRHPSLEGPVCVYTPAMQPPEPVGVRTQRYAHTACRPHSSHALGVCHSGQETTSSHHLDHPQGETSKRVTTDVELSNFKARLWRASQLGSPQVLVASESREAGV